MELNTTMDLEIIEQNSDDAPGNRDIAADDFKDWLHFPDDLGSKIVAIQVQKQVN